MGYDVNKLTKLEHLQLLAQKIKITFCSKAEFNKLTEKVNDLEKQISDLKNQLN